MRALTELHERQVTYQQLIGGIKHVKNYRIFFTCIVAAFLKDGNACITPQFT